MKSDEEKRKLRFSLFVNSNNKQASTPIKSKPRRGRKSLNGTETSEVVAESTESGSKPEAESEIEQAVEAETPKRVERY